MRGLRGRTLDAARAEILADLEGERAELDTLTAKIVAEGLATLATPRRQRREGADRARRLASARNAWKRKAIWSASAPCSTTSSARTI